MMEMHIRKAIDINAYFWEGHNCLWGITWGKAYLYKIDLEERIIDEIMPLLDEPNLFRAFSDILPCGDFIAFIPGCSDSLVIVDRISKTKEQIPLPEYGKKIGTSGVRFFTGIFFKNCVFMFGYSYPGIVKVDLCKKETVVIDRWLESADVLFTDETDGCFHVQYYRNGNLVYFPFMNANAVMEFDLEKEKAIIHKVGDRHQRYISIEWDGSNFWLIPRDGSVGSIVKWNPVSDETLHYRKYPKGFNYDKYAFYRTVNIGDKIFLFAHQSNMNIEIDIATGEMNGFADVYDTSDRKAGKYLHAELRGDKIFFINDSQCIWWNYVSGEKEYLLYYDRERICDRGKNEELKRFFGKKGGIPVGESEQINLNSLITYLKSYEEREQGMGIG